MQRSFNFPLLDIIWNFNIHIFNHSKLINLKLVLALNSSTMYLLEFFKLVENRKSDEKKEVIVC